MNTKGGKMLAKVKSGGILVLKDILLMWKWIYQMASSF